MKQIFNPFLPLDEYIPDGEPHVFGDRIYLYGSHDTEGGTRYCSEDDYLCYSAPVDDLTNWRCDGVIFSKNQNPYCIEGQYNDMYAPDVVQGNDGRFYLFFAVDDPSRNLLHVASCDTPTGRFEYLGHLKNQDGTPYNTYLCGDPGVINDNGTVRVYHGWSLSSVAGEANGRGAMPVPEPGSEEMKTSLKMAYKMMFNIEWEDVAHLPEPYMGANHVVLQDDMLTIAEEPKRIVQGQFDTLKTSSFYGHAFYEASSIRKINGIYYFIYSSENSNELCYATSKYPDRDFEYRGVIISNGDIGYNRRKKEDRLNMTANNHGSIEHINGQWYIFYHRQTHNSTFSRQACAELIEIAEDGSIKQVECTTMGLNGKSLIPKGEYLAAYACNITNGKMPHVTNRIVNADIPYITHEDSERFITNIKENTLIGFKYFEFNGNVEITLKSRGEGNGKFVIATDELCKDEILNVIEIKENPQWIESSAEIYTVGKKALYLKFYGDKFIDLLSINFK